MRYTCIAWQPSSKLGGEVLWFDEDLGLTRRARRAKIKRERVKVVREGHTRRHKKYITSVNNLISISELRLYFFLLISCKKCLYHTVQKYSSEIISVNLYK
jgi:hypothetical protein